MAGRSVAQPTVRGSEVAAVAGFSSSGGGGFKGRGDPQRAVGVSSTAFELQSRNDHEVFGIPSRRARRG